MPFLVSWPGRIPPGTTNHAMILNVDFAPTFLELAGLPVPADMQGRSLAPLIEDRRPADWRTSIYYRYYHYPAHHRVQPHLGVRTDRYKLIHFHRLDQWELYDLQTDPYETNNVYASPAHADTVKTLQAELARLKKELKDEDQFAQELSDGEAIQPVALELALRYDFAKLADDILPDQSGKGHAGKPQQVRRVKGLISDALRLDGQGQVTVGSPRTLDPAQKGLTVGAWCRPENPDGVLISMGGGAQGFSLYLKDGVPHFALRSGGQMFDVQATNRISLAEWTHLAAMLHDNGSVQLLVNGKPAGSRKAQAIRSKPREGLTVGADPGGAVGDYAAPSSWHGLIEDVRLYWGQLDKDALEDWSTKPSKP